MTWFKSLIMRQNSPLLLIDPTPNRAQRRHTPAEATSRHHHGRVLLGNSGGLRGNANGNNNTEPINVQRGRQTQVRSKWSSVKLAHIDMGRASCQGLRRNEFLKQDQNGRDEKRDEDEIEDARERQRREVNENEVLLPLRLPHLVPQAANCQPDLVHSTPLADRSRLMPAANNSHQEMTHKTTRPKQQQQQDTEDQHQKVLEAQSGARSISTSQQQQHQQRHKARQVKMLAQNKHLPQASSLGSYRLQALAILASSLTLLLLSSLFVAEAASGSQSGSQQYFEVQPEHQYLVHNGHEARLRCLIRNRQGECLWLKNGKAIGAIAKKYMFTREPQDGDCSLTIRNVSVLQDDGTWQCQVTASDVEQDTLQSREVNLVVLVAPERPQIKNMSQNTQRLVLEENKSKFVLCEMRGGNPAPQIEWILDNKNITKEAQTSSTSGQQGQTSQRITQSRLKMSDIKRSMNGKNLTCVGVHQTLNQSASVELDVQYVPTVSVVQREYSIVEGSPLSISCQVDSNPPPNLVNWRLVSDASGGRQQQSSTGLSLPTRPGPVLEFERISRDLNQNIFECLAQNAYGISLPADVKLNVLYAPFLLNTSHSESVMVGSQAQLACLFDGNPEPEVKWHYTDPLSRSALAVQLDNNRQQYLNIKNVTYRNEGDYHCEARNQINGVYYGVRSSNIILDVFGEPQFLVKSPSYAKAIQGTKSDFSLTFCSDPPPNKIYWQFGSIRLDVRLPNSNGATNGQQLPLPNQLQVAALPGGGNSKQSAVNQRFQVHPLLSLQKRESGFSKVPTCFEAQLSILDPELTDQRDYTLAVHNERGYQSAVVRLRVTSPLSPVLMITSAFVTICGLFLLSLVAMFLVKRRHESASDSANGGPNSGPQANGRGGENLMNAHNSLNRGEKNAIEHLKSGVMNGSNGTASALAAAAVAAANGQLMQQTRGIVNGAGNGMANGASNPTGHSAHNNGGGPSLTGSEEAKLHLMSMASSDTSGDQKQLLANSDRNSSGSGSTNNQCVDFHVHSSSSLNSGLVSQNTGHSTANSTPTPLNHMSVEQELNEDETSSYQGGIGISSGRPGGSTMGGHEAPLSPHGSPHHLNGTSALIYANLDYNDQQQHHHRSLALSPDSGSTKGGQQQPQQVQEQQLSPQHQMGSLVASVNHPLGAAANIGQQQQQLQTPQRRQQTPMEHSPSGSSLMEPQSILEMPTSNQQQQQQLGQRHQASPTGAIRSSVGATIAMMNSLAAAANQQVPGSSPNSGVLNGAINQQLANSRQIRKPGPPKPPKPSIQQRSRFYQQHAAAAANGNGNNNNNQGLVMIGSSANATSGNGSNGFHQHHHHHQQINSGAPGEPSANELAVEYSRIAFPARAEL